METNHFTLKDFTTIFSAAAQKKAEKLPLREVEETDKGQWVAFADDGPESYDVQVTIEKGMIIAHSCDCGKMDAQGFCLHQLALLMQLSAKKTKTAKPVTKRKVKEDPLTTMLNQVDTDDLKLWLKEVLHQQKDLAIAFTNRFAPKPVDYITEDIQKITDSVVRSVVKNKRKIDQSELKKIILLWKEVHEPVISHYLSNIASVDKIELLATLLLSIEKWNLSFNINSTKVDTYIKDVFAQLIQPLYDIEQEGVWEEILSGFFKQGFNGMNAAGTTWLTFLSSLVKFETRPSRVDFMLDRFKEQYVKIKAKKGTFLTEYFTQLVYTTFKNAGRTKDCIEWMQPILYNNDFNLELIDALLMYGNDFEAETVCRTIIKSNHQVEYNIPYLKRLASLYKKEPMQKAKLYPVLLELLPYSGTIEDYLIIKNEFYRNKEEDLKKWRTRILNKLDSNHRSTNEQTNLYFDILHHEGKLSKMLDRIRNAHTVQLALKYFDVLFAYNKILFLEAITRISSGYFRSDKDEEFFPLLAEKIRKHYTDYEIKNVVLKKENYWKGEFALYFEKTMIVG